MTDIEKAKQSLAGHTIALCKGGDIVTSDKRGIAPMLGFIAENRNLAGYSVADLIVGKAAAMLFVKAGIAAVHAKTLSIAGRDFLQSHGVPVMYDVLTERIFNRDKTDVCPMEKTVENLSDCDTAHVALSGKAEELRRLREANANR